MQYVRLIARKHWDPKLQRFNRLAFKPSSNNGGISVVEYECLSEISASICAHIRQFYARVAGEPPIFWLFPFETLPRTIAVDTTASDTGDDCHRDLIGLSETQAKEIFKSVWDDLENFKICENGVHRQLTLSDLTPAR
jgi:hypothetical protein